MRTLQRALAGSGPAALTVALAATAASAGAATTPTKASVSSDDGTPRLLGGLGLVAGAYGLTRKRAS